MIKYLYLTIKLICCLVNYVFNKEEFFTMSRLEKRKYNQTFISSKCYSEEKDSAIALSDLDCISPVALAQIFSSTHVKDIFFLLLPCLTEANVWLLPNAVFNLSYSAIFLMRFLWYTSLLMSKHILLENTNLSF